MADFPGLRCTSQNKVSKAHCRTLTLVNRRKSIDALAGLQGQDPELPYFGLWNRIEGFALTDLTRLLEERLVLRATLFRGTQHLLAASDYLWVRPLLQPMLDVWRRDTGDTLWTKLGGVNLDGDNEVSVNVLHFTEYALAW